MPLVFGVPIVRKVIVLVYFDKLLKGLEEYDLKKKKQEVRFALEKVTLLILFIR